MRHNLVSAVLLAMMGALGALVWISHDGDAAAKVVVAPQTPAAAAAKKAGEPPKLARTLRTTALGYELLAPGAISLDAFKVAGVDSAFASAPTMEDVETALAKGGEAGGADIALVPLSSYVASYEHLRALSPEVVFVAGWSRGREAIYGDLGKLTPTMKLSGVPGTPATFFALEVLDLAGVKVELADKAPLQAVPNKAAGKLALSSADAPHLMPIVAVVPRGFADAHTHELELWLRVWLAGVTRLEADVPAAARTVAALPGAPPVLAIIEGLGQLDFAGLRDNAAAFGLSGRGALTLDELFRTTWRLWRDTGVLTTPPPEVSPLEPKLLAMLARTDPGALVDPPHGKPSADTRKGVLLVIPLDPKLDADAVAARIGLVAGIFDRLSLRVTAKTDALGPKVIDTARARFDLRASQLTVGKRATPAIEVLP